MNKNKRGEEERKKEGRKDTKMEKVNRRLSKKVRLIARYGTEGEIIIIIKVIIIIIRGGICK
jgi:hypothetical protein